MNYVGVLNILYGEEMLQHPAILIPTELVVANSKRR